MCRPVSPRHLARTYGTAHDQAMFFDRKEHTMIHVEYTELRILIRELLEIVRVVA